MYFEVMVSCQGCGTETDTELCCPRCNQLGRTSFFCSQQCFRSNWAAHNKLHAVIEQSQVATARDIPPIGPILEYSGTFQDQGQPAQPFGSATSSKFPTQLAQSSVLQRKITPTATATTTIAGVGTESISTSSGSTASTAVSSSTASASSSTASSTSSSSSSQPAVPAPSASSASQPTPAAAASAPQWWRFAVQRQVDKVFRTFSGADKVRRPNVFSHHGRISSIAGSIGLGERNPHTSSSSDSSGSYPSSASLPTVSRGSGASSRGRTDGSRSCLLYLVVVACLCTVMLTARKAFRSTVDLSTTEGQEAETIPLPPPQSEFKSKVGVLSDAASGASSQVPASAGQRAVPSHDAPVHEQLESALAAVEKLERRMAFQESETRRLQKLLGERGNVSDSGAAGAAVVVESASVGNGGSGTKSGGALVGLGKTRLPTPPSDAGPTGPSNVGVVKAEIAPATSPGRVSLRKPRMSGGGELVGGAGLGPME